MKLTALLVSILMVLSSVIILTLGGIHVIYTFSGKKLTPRDSTLRIRMMEISPGITRETIMWKAWVGFNVSHSYGAILFGLIYDYLAVAQSRVLFNSPFQLAVGLAMLGGLLFLGKLYWFSIPFRGVLVATMSLALLSG